ncbi:MAG: serine/threonine-protein kinase, partial [Myxococcota bacterium]
MAKRDESVDAIAPGDQLGRYRIDHKIADGGFGQVFRATRDDGLVVAVKVLHRELVENRQAVMRFEREARTLSLLKHPNVIEIIDLGLLDQGRPYFATELLDGEDLGRRLARDGRMSPAETLAILTPVCAALAAAHAKGIVHRDIKASNVFLADSAQRVVLLDFGVAKLLEDTGPALTGSRHIVGTPAAMAPEQIRSEPVDERTDVYALGVLTYHLLAGKLPFQHQNPAVMMDFHLNESPPPLSSVAPLPAVVDLAIERAMAKEPDDRPADPAAFMDALEAALSASRPEPDNSAADGDTVLALYAELRIDAEAMTIADDTVVDEIEEILPELHARLTQLGFHPAASSGNSTLLIANDGDVNRVVEIARTLHIELERAPCTLALFVRKGPRAELERVADWVPEDCDSGVFSL